MFKYPLAIASLCLGFALTATPAACESKNFRTLQLTALKEMREAMLASQAADDVMIKEIDAVAKDLKLVLAKRVKARSNEPLRMNRGETAQLAEKLTRPLKNNPYNRYPYNKDATTDNSTLTSNSSAPDIQALLRAKNGTPVLQPVATSSTAANPQSVLPTSTTQTSANSLDPPPANSSSPFKPAEVQAHAVAVKDVRVKIIADPTVSFTNAEIWRKKMPDDFVSEPGTIQVVHNGFDSCLIWGAGVEGRPVFDRDRQRFKLVSIRLGNH